MRTLIVSDEADADLTEIWRHSAVTWGSEQADKYLDGLDDRMTGLLRGTTATQSVEHIAPGLRRALAGRHVVFFREDEARVVVVRVLHQGMDVGRMG